MTSTTPALPVAPGTADGPALDQLAVDLRTALLRSARRLRATKSLEDLTDPQFSVLVQLHTGGPLTPGELATAEHVRPPSMTRTLTALGEAGLVQRADHPDDRRQVLVSLTAAGRDAVEETRRRRSAWLAGRLAGLDAAQRATLADAARLLSTVIAP